jgi:class 3 adenylate cyclase
METRVQTIMFIDMQGYTRRSARQTVDEMKLFHDELHGFVNTNLQKWTGVLVKTLGDGFLARFDSPTQAVQCGLEMQKKLESRNAQMVNPDNLVHFRIGINTGDVGIDENGDLFGDPVNIASRIQSFAEPNEVYISEATQLAMNQNEFHVSDLGPQMFKNATREIRVYKIVKDPKEAARKGSGPGNGAKNAAGAGEWRKNPFFLGMVGVFVGFLILSTLGKIKNRLTRPKPDATSMPAVAPNATTAVAPLPTPSLPGTPMVNPSRRPDAPPDFDIDDGIDIGKRNFDKIKLGPGQRSVAHEVQKLAAAQKFAEAAALAEQNLPEVRAQTKDPRQKAKILNAVSHLFVMAKNMPKAKKYLQEAVHAAPLGSPMRRQFEANLKKMP